MGSCVVKDYALRGITRHEDSIADALVAGTGRLRAGDERFGRSDCGAQAARAGKLDH